MPNNKHVFIVLEGVDGSGKSSSGRKLARKLNAEHCEIPMAPLCNFKHLFRESNALTSFLFYFLCNLHASFLIARKLKKTSVVCSRYIHSTWAHHLIYGLGFLKIVSPMSFPVLKPNRIFFLHVTERERRRRISTRSKNNKKDMDCETLMAVQDLCLSRNELTVVKTDGLTTMEVADEVKRLIEQQVE